MKKSKKKNKFFFLPHRFMRANSWECINLVQKWFTLHSCKSKTKSDACVFEKKKKKSKMNDYDYLA